MLMPLEALAFATPSTNYLTTVIIALFVTLIPVLFKTSRLWLFRQTLRALTYGYLLRFPLLTGAAMVLGLFGGASYFAPTLLGNLFDIRWFGGIFLLSLAACAAALTVMTTWRMVVRNSDERFHLRFLKTAGTGNGEAEGGETNNEETNDEAAGNADYLFRVRPVVGWAQVAKFIWMALLVVGYACYYTITRNRLDPASSAWVISEALVGFAVALLIPWASRRWLSNMVRLPAKAGRIFRRIPPDIGRGYLQYDKNKRVIRLWPGHVTAAILFVVTLAFYVGVGVVKYYRLGLAPYLPTLGYVLLLLTMLCWGLSGLAFFLDRFRIPVLVPLLLLLVFTSLMPWSDHYYPVEPYDLSGRKRARPAARPSPTPVPAPDNKIIVVAANGGGIQAAAWTARVLTMLQHEFGDDFGRRLRVISSVSGGSVGAMYFVNEYEGGRPPSEAEMVGIMERVGGSSLDEIAWGLVYTDTLRLLTSYGTVWDRGRALEYAWLRRDHSEWPKREGILAGLSEWRSDVEAGLRPGTIFNATNSDTGQRLPFSTVALPPDSEGRRTADALFRSIGGDKDIPVLTAARLSASFPYVSPAARAGVDGEAAHVVDGGYYDNYGISSLVEWLDHELYKNNERPDGQKITDVLFIEIRGSLTGDATVEVNGKAMVEARGYDQPESGEARQFKTSRGWFYQAFAPLSTLMNVRDTGQRSHNVVELRLLIEKWRDIDEKKARRVTIRDVVFECDDAAPPLSWHLNEEEKRRLNDNWEKERKGGRNQGGLLGEPGKDGLTVVGEFLGKAPQRRPPPVSAR